jgi:hypothetical protein
MGRNIQVYALGMNCLGTNRPNVDKFMMVQVVAGANILRVFRLVPDESDAALLLTDSHGQPSRPPKMRLECMASFALNGVCSGIEKVF